MTSRIQSSKKLIKLTKESFQRGLATATTSSSTPIASTSTSSSSSSSTNSPDLSYLQQITPGDTSRSRYKEYYNNTLSHDLLYLLYSHANHTQSKTLPNPLTRSPIWSPTNPYATNRPPPRPKGNRYLVPNPSFTSAKTLPKLLSITLATMDKTALSSKNNLLTLLMAYESITGESPQSKHPGQYGPGSGRGLIITKSTKKSASFKIRPGAPTGVKVTLKGEPMYRFLETLVEFVLPRLKTFIGVALPNASHPKQSVSSTSGVVAFGLPSEAMGLFPQIEQNLDQYPRSLGMNIYCVTSARGRGAQDQARALLSGLAIPFVKK